MSRRALALAAVMALPLAGCGDPNTEVRAWMAEVAERTKPEIDPLPVLEPPEEFVYARAGLEDPFADRLQEETVPEQAQAHDGDGVAPDPLRPREALEAFPFDSLRMVGTMSRQEQLWALVRAPDDTINRVAVGNYLGQNHGRVTRVDAERVEVVEIVPTGTGRWVEREASLALTEQP